MTIQVQVNRRDVLHGVQYSACHCPLGKSMSRAFNRQIHIGSCYFTIYTGDGSEGPSFFLPRIAREFRLAFDQGKRLEPITFQVQTPDTLPPYNPNPEEWYQRR